MAPINVSFGTRTEMENVIASIEPITGANWKKVQETFVTVMNPGSDILLNQEDEWFVMKVHSYDKGTITKWSIDTILRPGDERWQTHGNQGTNLNIASWLQNAKCSLYVLHPLFASKKRKKRLPKFKAGQTVDDFIVQLMKQREDMDETRVKWLETFQRCVLSQVVKETIDEALTVVLMSHKFDEWGINDHFEKGITNSLLLYGPPGTGKTMIAESIAAVLDKNIMKVTTADIQSQIPGQAERNMTKFFEEATKNNAILMFDECDSLLYNRDAVGMIMSSEINHLLSQIENFAGVCVFTTNRLGKLDEALQRRIIAKIKLDLPNKEARTIIWKNLMPPKMPIEEDVDHSKLAETEIAGGDIKNAILLSARRCIARNQEKVKMADFEHCVEQIMKTKAEFENSRDKAVFQQEGYRPASKVSKLEYKKVVGSMS